MSFVNKETVRMQIQAFRGAQGPVGPAGPQGVQGPAGADGRDYILTEADKQEIAGMVGGNGSGSSVELDTTLTQSGKAADAKATGDAINVLREANTAQDERLTTLENAGSGTTDYSALENKPSINGVELSGDKSLSDLGIGTPTEEQVSGAVKEWLDDHPEATTTVADGSITPQKLSFYTAKRSAKTLATELDTSKFEAITGSSDTSQAGQLGLWYPGSLSESIPVDGPLNILKRNGWAAFSKYCNISVVFYDADGNHVRTVLTQGTDFYTIGNYNVDTNEYFQLYSVPIPEGAATYRWYIKSGATLDDLSAIEFLDFEALIDHKPWVSEEVSDLLEQNDAVTGNVFWNYKTDATNSLVIKKTDDVTPFDFLPADFDNVKIHGNTLETAKPNHNVRVYFNPISLGERTEIYISLNYAKNSDAAFRINVPCGLLAYDENMNPLTAKGLCYHAVENALVTAELIEMRYDAEPGRRLYKITVDPSVKYLLPVLASVYEDTPYEDRMFVGVQPFNPRLTDEEIVAFEAPLAVKNYINDSVCPDYYRFNQIGRLVPNFSAKYVAWNHNLLHYDATRNVYVLTMKGRDTHGGNGIPSYTKLVKIDPVTLESTADDIYIGGVLVDWVNGFVLDDSDNYHMICHVGTARHYVTSTDGGTTWTDGGEITVDASGAANADALTYDYPEFFSVYRLNTGTFLASYDDTVSPTNKQYSFVARSTDGINWTLIEISGRGVCEMAFYEHDGTVMMIGRRNTYMYDITSDATGETYNNAVISYSNDDGQTWTPATGSVTVRANVQNVSVREHDGVVEMMAMNRDFKKYPHGYIYHYTATPKEALADRFTLREVFQCNAYAAGDVTGGALAFDRYGRGLFAYSDNHGVNSNYDYLHFLYGARAEAPMVCADGVASEFLPYSGRKVQSMIDALEARIAALEG